MIDVVINYDKEHSEYRIYESSTKTLLIAQNLSKGLISLNEFLKNSGLIKQDLFFDKGIEYHLDSDTMIAFVESNLELVKQLKSGPSGFSLAESKFSSKKQGLPPMNKFDLSRSSFESSFSKNSGFGGKSAFGKTWKKW